VYANGHMVGYHYEHLKDNLRWHGLKPKYYVPLMMSMLNRFIEKTPASV
jgi:hypothetical protein